MRDLLINGSKLIFIQVVIQIKVQDDFDKMSKHVTTSMTAGIKISILKL